MMSSTSTGAGDLATCSRMANERAVAPSFCSLALTALPGRDAGFNSLTLRGGVPATVPTAAALASSSRVVRMDHLTFSSSRDGASGAPLLQDREQQHDDGEHHDRAGNRTAEEDRPVIAEADHRIHEGFLGQRAENDAEHQ